MKLVIDDYTEEQRLDTYLAQYLQDISRSRIQTEIKNGNITVNTSLAKPSYKLKLNDVICINITANIPNIEPESIPIDILWEDENMAIVNKPSGMLTHPTTIEYSGTLVNALLNIYGKHLSDINGELRPGIVHRLDRNTSGLLMIAKNNEAHKYLVDMMKSRQIEKTYRAFTKGVINEDEFIINKPIGRNPNQPHKMGVYDNGKESISKVKVIKKFKEATSVEIILVTGRTHQIRVHMSSIGHPIYNDTLYGFGKIKIKTEEQVLQAFKLTFPKPYFGEKITIEIPPDKKYEKILSALSSSNSI